MSWSVVKFISECAIFSVPVDTSPMWVQYFVNGASPVYKVLDPHRARVDGHREDGALADELHEPDVGPVLRERRESRVRLAFRDLILMVRKDEVLAAGVDVDLVAQRLAHHRRALDVPA